MAPGEGSAPSYPDLTGRFIPNYDTPEQLLSLLSNK